MRASADTRIAAIRSRSLLDGHGLPALEAEVQLACGAIGRAAVPTNMPTPAAAAVSAPERQPLVDGGSALGGRGLTRARAFVGEELAPAVTGLDAADQGGLDRRLSAILRGGLRGAPVPRPGCNATLAVSLATARAAARAAGVPLWRMLEGRAGGVRALPMPIVGVLETDPAQIGLARVSLVPVGAERLEDALDWCAEAVRETGAALDRMRLPAVAGRHGGFAAPLEEAEHALDIVTRAIERAGLTPGEDLALAVDVSAAAFGSGGSYMIAASGARLDTQTMIARALSWLRRAPIALLEDPLAPDAGAGWPELTRAAGQAVRVVMREAIQHEASRIATAAEAAACRGVALTAVAFGTLSGVIEARLAARAGGLDMVLSAERSETEDDWLAELALGLGADMFAAGGLMGGERSGKWNALARLSAALPEGARRLGRAG